MAFEQTLERSEGLTRLPGAGRSQAEERARAVTLRPSGESIFGPLAGRRCVRMAAAVRVSRGGC